MFFKVVPFYFFQTCAFFKIKKVIASILSPSVTYHFLNNVHHTNWVGQLYTFKNIILPNTRYQLPIFFNLSKTTEYLDLKINRLLSI